MGTNSQSHLTWIYTNRFILQEEKLWLEEQNRLAAERLQARLEKERQLAEAERLKCNPVDYDAAARLAYECSGSNDGFSTFRSKYLTDTSAMIAEKQKERVAVAKREVERLEAERLAAEEAKRLEVERLAAEEAKRREAKEAERLAAERMAAEAAARAEEERRLEAEEAKRRQAEEAKRLEAERLQAEEASRMEEQKRRAEAEAAARAKAEEEASAAKREAERVMREEEARLLEEQAAAAREAVLLSGQQDVMEDDEINDDDWEASVRLANQLSGLEGFDDDDIDMDEIDELLQAEMADLTEDEEELLGKAAREAVRKYEEEMAMKRSAKQSARSAWDEQLVESSPEPEEVVEKATSGDANVDYSQMTVAELKEMLRSRGLKVGGKKSELIERLMSS
jgi:membrane protein involved in colicin uptake